MDKALYEDFKRALAEERERAIGDIEEQYKRNLADLEALWTRVTSNGHMRTGTVVQHPTGTTVRDRNRTDPERVRNIVRSIPVGHEVSQPVVSDMWKRRYPKRSFPTRTLVSRILRRWHEAGALDPVGDSALGQVKIYVKTGNIE